MLKTKKAIIPLLGLLYVMALSFFAWGLAAGVYKIFPWSQIAAVYEELHDYFTFTEGPEKSTKDKIVLDHQERRSNYGFAGLRKRDIDFIDSGYLLISAYSKKHNQVVVKLFSMAKSEVIFIWVPPIKQILERTPKFVSGTNTYTTYRVQHPLLLEDGDLIFTSGEGPMVRINSCGNIIWILEHHFHHSIELDHFGNIITCSKLGGDQNATVFPVRDDGVAVVSPMGDIINEYSIAKLMLENGYKTLMYGIGRFEKDRFHLNDAQPILRETNDANVGDILLSIRNLSSVALLDPRNGNIKWLKTGPWLNQHDINQLQDGRYSIFGNDIVRGYKEKGNKLAEDGKSDIYIYDPIRNVVSQPYASIMNKEKIASRTEGRSRILSNRDAYIEQTNSSRLLRISQDKVRWEYVNAVSEDTVGALHWSRYYANKEIDLTWLENQTCD